MKFKPGQTRHLLVHPRKHFTHRSCTSSSSDWPWQTKHPIVAKQPASTVKDCTFALDQQGSAWVLDSWKCLPPSLGELPLPVSHHHLHQQRFGLWQGCPGPWSIFIYLCSNSLFWRDAATQAEVPPGHTWKALLLLLNPRAHAFPAKLATTSSPLWKLHGDTSMWQPT